MPVQPLSEIIHQRPKGKALMGLDVGKKTVGVAVCDPAHQLATPLTTIQRSKFTKDVEALKSLITEYEIGGFVIGLPLNMDGTEGPRAQSIRDFALEFDKALSGGRWIALWDKRLSTVSVEEFVNTLVDKRKTKTNSKSSGLIDKLAAQIILQGALDYIDLNQK
jgi:putative Holliday junction resolvase